MTNREWLPHTAGQSRFARLASGLLAKLAKARGTTAWISPADNCISESVDLLEQLGRRLIRSRGYSDITMSRPHGCRLTLTIDASYDLVMNITSGWLDNLDDTAAILQRVTRLWS